MLSGLVFLLVVFAFFLLGAGAFVLVGGVMEKGRVPLAVGAWVGACFVGLLAGVVAYSAVRKKEHDVRLGWNLVPVVVAAVDMKENSTVTFDVISQRSVPEQFVTSSVVKPDSASHVVNQRIQVPVQAGDPLLWSMFEKKPAAAMLIASHDIGPGSALAETDVEVRELPKDFVTPSFVSEHDRPQLVGRRLIAPFRKGDPIQWTHFAAAP